MGIVEGFEVGGAVLVVCEGNVCTAAGTVSCKVGGGR